METVKKHIAGLVSAINNAFSNGEESALRTALDEIFHRDMVIRGPEFVLMAEGKKACIDSYVRFANEASVISFETTELVIDVFDDMATAKCAWQLRYEMGGSQYDQKGDEVFMFVHEGGKWLAAWRAQSAMP
ncbi:MAG: nuclear transport factor 2 family protein [Candidatus Baltobacteraceae bacterium]